MRVSVAAFVRGAPICSRSSTRVSVPRHPPSRFPKRGIAAVPSLTVARFPAFLNIAFLMTQAKEQTLFAELHERLDATMGAVEERRREAGAALPPHDYVESIARSVQARFLKGIGRSFGMRGGLDEGKGSTPSRAPCAQLGGAPSLLASSACCSSLCAMPHSSPLIPRFPSTHPAGLSLAKADPRTAGGSSASFLSPRSHPLSGWAVPGQGGPADSRWLHRGAHVPARAAIQSHGNA